MCDQSVNHGKIIMTTKSIEKEVFDDCKKVNSLAQKLINRLLLFENANGECVHAHTGKVNSSIENSIQIDYVLLMHLFRLKQQEKMKRRNIQPVD